MKLVLGVERLVYVLLSKMLSSMFTLAYVYTL